MFTTPLRVELLPEQSGWFSPRVELLWPLEWQGQEHITVPAGLVSDLTTLFPEGRHTRASVLHDFMLKSGYSWKDANETMMQAMESDEVNPIIADLIYTGIELNRFRHWVLK